jgi:phage tail sheath protein FI
MMTYSRPGVYVTERLLPAPITSAGTVNAVGCAVGQFAQGPITPVLVDSWYQFTQIFGGYSIAYPATFGVGEFFKSGGTQLYVQRVLGAGADKAAVTIPASTSGNIGSVTALDPGTAGNDLRVVFTASDQGTGYFNLLVYKEIVVGSTTSSTVSDDVLVEQFNNVVFNDVNSGDYIVTVVQFQSQYISVTISDNTKVPATSGTPLALTAGDNGTTPVVASDYMTSTHVENLKKIESPLVLFAPELQRSIASGFATVHTAMATYAEANNGFAVLDTAPDLTPSQALSYSASIGTFSHSAVYYPNIFIADPLGRNSGSIRKCGPAGSVAGLYLSTDRDFGPFKAPAGLRSALGGAVTTELRLTSDDLDDLNTGSAPVNAIRDVPGSGVVVMGARTLKQDGTANRYVSMRRSLIYLNKSLKEITQFALFQNNDERLWSQIRTAISVFLSAYQNNGGLSGTTPDEAFYVKCDSENNPFDTVANGEVHIEVGVSLEYPAEFVVITLSQKTAN